MSAKGNKAKRSAKQGESRKASSEKKGVGAARANTKAASRRKRRNLDSVLRNLDIASLSEGDIARVMLHCEAALSFRKAIDTSGMSMARSSASYCYTKSGSSSTVSIWSGGFKVGEISEAEAQRNGIPPCG
jgi:hypothetical protein